MGFYIDMVNVGQGDAFLLSLDDPNYGVYYILVDGGSVKTTDYLIKHLKSITNGHIHTIIATHLDSDHIGGLRGVLENMSVGCILINTPLNLKDWLAARDTFKRMGEKVLSALEIAENLSVVDNLIQTIERLKIRCEPALAGRCWNHGDEIMISVINPTADRLKAAWANEVLQETIQGMVLGESEAPKTSPRNNASIVFELWYKKEPHALFTADAGADVIKEVSQGRRYSFLKLPHHGGKTGMDEELTKQIKPNTVYLSVGDNPHGHPATEVLDFIKKVGAKVYCTNRTKYCRKDCKHAGYGNVCYRHEKDVRPTWIVTDPSKCANNI